MKPRWIAVAVVCLVGSLLIGAGTARAQYMFLDVNGDGAYNYEDQYGCADTLNIDVYLVTNTTEYGSPSACPQDGSEIDLNSYELNLYAMETPVSFSNLTNRMAGMVPLAAPSVYPYALHVVYGGPLAFPPGKYRIFSFTVVGCGILSIVPFSCYSPPGTVTSFGSSCPGSQGDNTLRLGEDWYGSLGIGHTDPIGSWPSVTCPAEITGREGQPLSFSVTVNDPDCGIWSFYAYGVPAGAVMGALGPFVAGDAVGMFHWTPAPGQAGTYAVTFDASDYPNPFHGITQRDTCTTVITILPAELPVRVFTSHANDPTRLPRGKPQTCFRVEPQAGAAFSLEDIVPASIALRYVDPGCGEVEVFTTPPKSQVFGDTDHDGVSEYEACFSLEAMRSLGECFSTGAHTVPLELQGQLTDGSRFHGRFTHTFVVTGGRLAAAISPNPISRASILEFTTKQAGSMTARLFDIRGRFIAALVERGSLDAGMHRVQLTGLEVIRERLASGVYFVQVATEHDGSETKTVTILR